MFFLLKPFQLVGKGVKSIFVHASGGLTEMKKMLLTQFISILLGLFTPDLLKKFMDTVLDFVEEHVKGSASDVDDAIVLPLCDMIRKAFDIPDDDES